MIIRSFRGTVTRGSEEPFYAIVRARFVRFRAEHGLIESHLARRMGPEGDRFLITTHWPDWETLHAWAPGELERPWGFDELLPYLVEWEIEHFEEIEAPERR